MWQKVGEIGVDAGLCWIGDPCYVFHRKENPTELGNSWSEFCDILYNKEEELQKAHKDDERPGATQFNYDLGHTGLGVCTSTGYGDGCYPVFVRKNNEGRVAEIRVVFIDSEDIEDEIERI